MVIPKNKKTLNYKYKRRDFSPRIKAEAYRKQNGKCWLCKKQLLPLKYCSFHHIKRYAQGGFSNLDNCAVMHFSCHWGKKSFKEIHGFNRNGVKWNKWVKKILVMEKLYGIEHNLL